MRLIKTIHGLPPESETGAVTLFLKIKLQDLSEGMPGFSPISSNPSVVQCS